MPTSSSPSSSSSSSATARRGPTTAATAAVAAARLHGIPSLWSDVVAGEAPAAIVLVSVAADRATRDGAKARHDRIEFDATKNAQA